MLLYNIIIYNIIYNIIHILHHLYTRYLLLKEKLLREHIL